MKLKRTSGIGVSCPGHDRNENRTRSSFGQLVLRFKSIEDSTRLRNF